MIILADTNDSLEVVLGGAVTTNQLPFVASFVDITTTTYVPDKNSGTTNNTTAVTLVAAPAASTQRELKFLSIYNADTVDATVTIQLNDNSTLRTIFKAVLNTGETIIYTASNGIQVFDVDGNLKSSMTSIGSAPNDADYLVGTANGTLTNEIVVGATPGGELGGTWGSPTVDATHSGSAHHTQSHDHSAAGDGSTLTPAVLNIPAAASPAQTADGQAVWDSDDDKLTIGDGSARKTFVPTAAVSGAITMDTAGAATLSANQRTRTITFVIDGGGSAITTGVKGDLEIPFGCTIVAATLLADQSGSIVIDIWKDTYANYPPTVDDTITASAKPTISTATKSQDTTLTGWTTSITAGDTLRFNVDSVTTITRVTLSLKVTVTN